MDHSFGLRHGRVGPLHCALLIGRFVNWRCWNSSERTWIVPLERIEWERSVLRRNTCRYWSIRRSGDICKCGGGGLEPTIIRVGGLRVGEIG